MSWNTSEYPCVTQGIRETIWVMDMLSGIVSTRIDFPFFHNVYREPVFDVRSIKVFEYVVVDCFFVYSDQPFLSHFPLRGIFSSLGMTIRRMSSSLVTSSHLSQYVIILIKRNSFFEATVSGCIVHVVNYKNLSASYAQNISYLCEKP